MELTQHKALALWQTVFNHHLDQPCCCQHTGQCCIVCFTVWFYVLPAPEETSCKAIPLSLPPLLHTRIGNTDGNHLYYSTQTWGSPRDTQVLSSLLRDARPGNFKSKSLFNISYTQPPMCCSPFKHTAEVQPASCQDWSVNFKPTPHFFPSDFNCAIRHNTLAI